MGVGSGMAWAYEEPKIQHFWAKRQSFEQRFDFNRDHLRGVGGTGGYSGRYMGGVHGVARVYRKAHEGQATRGAWVGMRAGKGICRHIRAHQHVGRCTGGYTACG